MVDRDIDSLDKLNGEAADAAKPQGGPVTAAKRAVEPVPTIELNYPEPTALSIVIKDVARWAKVSFVMEPSINARIQIFAPRKLYPVEAYEIFLAALSVVGLRAVQIGFVVKIVPVSLVVSA